MLPTQLPFIQHKNLYKKDCQSFKKSKPHSIALPYSALAVTAPF